MGKGLIYIYTGDGRGKSPAALGRAVQAAAEGKSVVVIQFLKGKGLGESEFLRRMEPEIKLF
ncbi:MAG: cob(I)yrinic acid a,c-diamide adenosyltransferase, partial [Lachnospiraceae bacterium]|nr:cob(I)yrinic acid a,c-diamide adenosyltransferase [Lachnospiraceae bacterium]